MADLHSPPPSAIVAHLDKLQRWQFYKPHLKNNQSVTLILILILQLDVIPLTPAKSFSTKASEPWMEDQSIATTITTSFNQPHLTTKHPKNTNSSWVSLPLPPIQLPVS